MSRPARCPACGRTLQDADPPEVTEAIRQMREQTAEIIGAELEDEE